MSFVIAQCFCPLLIVFVRVIVQLHLAFHQFSVLHRRHHKTRTNCARVNAIVYFISLPFLLHSAVPRPFANTIQERFVFWDCSTQIFVSFIRDWLGSSSASHWSPRLGHKKCPLSDRASRLCIYVWSGFFWLLWNWAEYVRMSESRWFELMDVFGRLMMGLLSVRGTETDDKQKPKRSGWLHCRRWCVCVCFGCGTRQRFLCSVLGDRGKVQIIYFQYTVCTRSVASSHKPYYFIALELNCGIIYIVSRLCVRLRFLLVCNLYDSLNCFELIFVWTMRGFLHTQTHTHIHLLQPTRTHTHICKFIRKTIKLSSWNSSFGKRRKRKIYDVSILMQISRQHNIRVIRSQLLDHPYPSIRFARYNISIF